MQHHHLLAPFCLVQIRSADHHAQTLLLHQLLHNMPQLTARQGVHPHRRLVKQEQIRRAHQGARQPQLLLHAPGKLARQPISELRQVRHVQQSLVALAPHVHGHALQVGVQIQVLLHRQVFVQAKPLRHVADAVLHLLGLRGRVQPQHAQLTAVRSQQGCRQPQQRRLARAIRPHQRHQTALRHLQAHISQRMHFGHPLASAEALVHAADVQRQTGRRDRACHGHCPEAATLGAPARSIVTVAGMPRRNWSCGSCACTRTSYTKALRNSSVCTVLGVNSATDAI